MGKKKRLFFNFFIDIFQILCLGVSHPLSKSQLYSILKLGRNKSNFNFKKYTKTVVKNLSLMTPAAYESLCSTIYQTPLNLSTKCFYKTEKMIKFLDYILHIHRLCILIKIILMFPLIKHLQRIEKQNKQNDIFLKVAKELKQWLYAAFIISFNGAKFDHIFLFNSTLSTLLVNKKVSISFQKSGNSFINIFFKYSHRYKNFSSPPFPVKKKDKNKFGINLPSSVRLCFKVS